MIANIHWASLEYFWSFILVAIVSALLGIRYAKQRNAQQILVGMQLQFLRNYSPVKQLFKSVLICMGVLFLCIALLRPQWNKSEETIVQEGRDLYIALD